VRACPSPSSISLPLLSFRLSRIPNAESVKRSPDTFTGIGPTTTAPSDAGAGAAAANVRAHGAPCPAWISCVRDKFLCGVLAQQAVFAVNILVR
jgi:hypothetical protein